MCLRCVNGALAAEGEGNAGGDGKDDHGVKEHAEHARMIAERAGPSQWHHAGTCSKAQCNLTPIGVVRAKDDVID